MEEDVDHDGGEKRKEGKQEDAHPDEGLQIEQPDYLFRQRVLLLPIGLLEEGRFDLVHEGHYRFDNYLQNELRYHLIVEVISEVVLSAIVDGRSRVLASGVGVEREQGETPEPCHPGDHLQVDEDEHRKVHYLCQVDPPDLLLDEIFLEVPFLVFADLLADEGHYDVNNRETH